MIPNRKRSAWKAVFGGLLALVLALGSVIPGFAEEERSYSWYCVHVPDHVQPRTGAELSFAEECGGYYRDASHSDPEGEDKVIYLTFDAGYENGNVSKILDALRDAGAPAAFFILSNLISSNPDLVKRMTEEGHAVCNHTAHHKDMTRLNREEFDSELAALENAYFELTGERIAPYYRPPEGRFNRSNLEEAQRLGYKTVFWSFAYPDWDNDRQPDPERAKRMILDNLHNGEVMLLHPTSATNAEILPALLLAIREAGYRFGTLDELTGCAGGAG